MITISLLATYAYCFSNVWPSISALRTIIIGSCLMVAISGIENDKTDPMKTKTQLKMRLSTVEVSIYIRSFLKNYMKFILELK